MADALLEAVRGLWLPLPDIVPKRLLAKLREQQPGLGAGNKEVREALAVLKAESRAARLDALPDEIQQLVFGQLCNALDPRPAVDYSSASIGLREPMQRVGEGTGKSPLEQLKEEHAAAAALGLKAEVRSCRALREATGVEWFAKGLSTTDLATLGKLIPVLPALETLRLIERSASPGPDGGQLVEGLGVGALPAVTHFVLRNVCVGDAGASALAAALWTEAPCRGSRSSICVAPPSATRVWWPSRRPCGGGPRWRSFVSMATLSATRASPPSWRRRRQMRRRRRLKRWRSSSGSSSTGPRSPTPAALAWPLG